VANRDIEAARNFHEITSHSYTSVRAGARPLDWANRPLPYKIYPTAGKLALPRELNLSAAPALSVIGGGTASGAAIDLDTITRLLFCAGGLTRRMRVGEEDYHFRAAASAGALYPIEIYLAAGGTDGLEQGLYHFSPADLKLSGLRRGDWREYLAEAAGGRQSIRRARNVLVMTAIFWRSAWKYRDRAYRYCFWDAGTMLANLFAAANADGIGFEAITAFEDARIESLLGIDGEREGVICLVALGDGPAAEPSPEIRPLELESIPLSQSESANDDLVKMHRAARLSAPDEVREAAAARLEHAALAPAGEASTPEPLSPADSIGLGETILRRGSTRMFSREAIGADELASILAVSSGTIPLDFPRLTETYVIINAVEGMESGAYYYRRETGALEMLKRGNFRPEAGYLCLEQPLGADCGALIIHMANLERVLGGLGNRGYGDAHLEAGVMGGRAYLASYSLGRGATGLTFYDCDTAEFLSPHASGMSPLLMLAVGAPRRREADNRGEDE
jgi:SagB-type dehydrogenase family enzyme